MDKVYMIENRKFKVIEDDIYSCQLCDAKDLCDKYDGHFPGTGRVVCGSYLKEVKIGFKEIFNELAKEVEGV